MPLAWYVAHLTQERLEAVAGVLEGGMQGAGNTGNGRTAGSAVVRDAGVAEQIRELSGNQRRMVVVVNCGGTFDSGAVGCAGGWG